MSAGGEQEFVIEGEVERYPGPNGWFFVAVPLAVSGELERFADRGLVAVTARLGDATFDTSLMPVGDGTQFLPLNAALRRAAGVGLGERVRVHVRRRSRR